MTLGVVALVVGVVVLVAARQSNRRGGGLDQTTAEDLVKQGVTRASRDGFTAAETAAIIVEHKQQAVALLAANGLAYDGSIDSIKGLDRLLDLNPEAARAGADAMGVYIGEAIRRVRRGTWTGWTTNGQLQLEFEMSDNGDAYKLLTLVRGHIEDRSSRGLYESAVRYVDAR